ncbi:hypothetical protein BGX33_000386 [Mortierella sp. NVP41]|nr:hypothetical protein BGX33_000386 [Mortierella sp. NVP41]
MAPPPTVILTLQEAVKVADALLIDALTSDNPSVQRYLCSYISETLSTIDEDTMDAASKCIGSVWRGNRRAHNREQ